MKSNRCPFQGSHSIPQNSDFVKGKIKIGKEKDMEIDKIYNMDCTAGLDKLNKRIDLVVTSPPYNVDLGKNKHNKNGYDKYNDNLPLDEYFDNMNNVFGKIYKKLWSGGRVAINIGALKNGEIPMDVYYTNMMNNIGFKTYTHIIWNKAQVGNRTSWGSWLSPSCPSFPTPFEHILVFYKDSKKLLHSGETDLERDEFINWSLALWSFPPESNQKKIGHPAMFPKELPRRLIKMFTYRGDLVIDPFNGAGTTTLVAKELGRHYVGFDISKKYCEIAERRIEND